MTDVIFSGYSTDERQEILRSFCALVLAEKFDFDALDTGHEMLQKHFDFLYRVLPSDDFTKALGRLWMFGGYIDTIEDAKAIAEKMGREGEHDVIAGVFSDIEGTLILGDKLNEPLYRTLLIAQKTGVDVVLFSGADESRRAQLTQKLQSFGVDSCLLPLRSKYEFSGKMLHAVVDNEPPFVYGIPTTKWVRVGSDGYMQQIQSIVEALAIAEPMPPVGVKRMGGNAAEFNS